MRRTVLLATIVATAAAFGGTSLAAGGHAHVGAHKSKLGRHLVDGRGFTLYLFEKDTNGKSHCYGACAHEWAPLLTKGKPKANAGAKASKLGTVKRKGGALQVTYAGHPLYHYDDDHKPGQMEGQGSKAFGAKWYVLAPSGHKIDND